MEENSLEPLDLEGLLPAPRVGPGRQAAPLVAELVRELTPADLTMPATVTQTPPAIKKLRDSHHGIARLLALGHKEHMVSSMTGYSLSRISILKADPQFAELVEFYRGQETEETVNFKLRMESLGIDALEELRHRLEDKPDELSAGLLKDIVRDMADRTGHAPQRGPSTLVDNSINVTLSERMAKSRERIKALMDQRLGPRTIDHAPGQ